MPADPDFDPAAPDGQARHQGAARRRSEPAQQLPAVCGMPAPGARLVTRASAACADLCAGREQVGHDERAYRTASWHRSSRRPISMKWMRRSGRCSRHRRWSRQTKCAAAIPRWKPRCLRGTLADAGRLAGQGRVPDGPEEVRSHLHSGAPVIAGSHPVYERNARRSRRGIRRGEFRHAGRDRFPGQTWLPGARAFRCGHGQRPFTGDTHRRDELLHSGAQFISTDYPASEPARWTNYSVSLPDGLIARCNPVNAPKGCKDALIESK